MKIKILLINPWVYDFAAANLWSRPLGLLKVAEYLSQFNVELALIDCLGSFHVKKFGKGRYPKEILKKPECLKTVPRKFGQYGISVNELREELIKKYPFDMVLITSIMSYWYPGIQKVIEIVRSEFKNVPIILGGIYATLWSKHASETSGADFIYQGKICENIKFALNTFGFRLKKKAKNHLRIDTPPSRGRGVITEPNTPPSTGGRGLGGGGNDLLKKTDEVVPYYKLGLYEHYPFAPVLTSTGCPFNCSYCSTKLLNNGFVQRRSGSIIREITELHTMGIRDFAFYDDALFVNPDSHIKVILKEIIGYGLDIRFHCPNGLHARFIDNELAYLMKESGFKTLRLSLETIDKNRQKQTGGKVSSDDLVNAVRNLKSNGFTKKDIGIYLMYGLPGQSLEEVKDGLVFLKSLDVRINLTEYSPIPETECWKELVNKGIIADDIDPLLTNNTVFSYLFAGYDRNELKKIKDDVNQYNAQPELS